MLIIVDNVQVNSGGDLGPFEPINSIPQAFDTGLDGGGLTTLSAFVGDGEFGATSGDYDFFSISADDGDTITIETFFFQLPWYWSRQVCRPLRQFWQPSRC